MKLTKFDSNELYVKTQARTDRRKSRRTSAKMTELERLSGYLTKERGLPSKGICHGVRHGDEVLMFRGLFPDCEVIGTDLLYDKPGLVTNADFHEQRDEWVGSFDFLYSNALDHSHSPEKCLKVWLDQLKPDGLAFVQWTLWHMGTKGGDCFGAFLHEYMVLASKVGIVRDLLYCDVARTQKTLIVISPNPRRRSRKRRERNT